MKQYDIFKSEGGWRYAGITWNGNPVMEHSPWFETREAAEKAAKEANEKITSPWIEEV